MARGNIEDYFPFGEVKDRSPLVWGIVNGNEIYLKAPNGVKVTVPQVREEELHDRFLSIAKELVGFRGYNISNLSDFLNEKEVVEVLKLKSTN